MTSVRIEVQSSLGDFQVEFAEQADITYRSFGEEKERERLVSLLDRAVARAAEAYGIEEPAETPKRSEIAAARLAVMLAEKAGREPEEWVRKISELPLTGDN